MAPSDKTRDENHSGDPIESPPTNAFTDNNGDGIADEPYEAEQLALDDDNERLPWLDADDDDSAEAESGRILGLVVLGLLALGVIVGGIWWSTHRTTDPTLVADGSTISAPPGDYKEAPKAPGGKTFDGTGNTAFAVSEGQNRPAKLGETAAPLPPGPPAKPGFDLGKPSAAVACYGKAIWCTPACSTPKSSR